MALPYRGDGSDRPGGFVVAPARMALWRDGRPLKQWRYVGVFGPRLMVCAGVVRLGPLPQVFWAVWDRERQALRERTYLLRRGGSVVSLAGGRVRVRDGAVHVDLAVGDGAPVETLSEHGPSWIWTRKQCAVPVRGTVEARRRAHRGRRARLRRRQRGLPRPLDRVGVVGRCRARWPTAAPSAGTS
jgi:hypothetical protein